MCKDFQNTFLNEISFKKLATKKIKKGLF